MGTLIYNSEVYAILAHFFYILWNFKLRKLIDEGISNLTLFSSFNQILQGIE